jgi:hypothetical protein
LQAPDGPHASGLDKAVHCCLIFIIQNNLLCALAL